MKKEENYFLLYLYAVSSTDVIKVMIKENSIFLKKTELRNTLTASCCSINFHMRRSNGCGEVLGKGMGDSGVSLIEASSQT